MEDNRNWQGWAALALAGLALMIALFGRNSTPSVVINMPNDATAAQTAPQSPPFQSARPARPNVDPGWLEPQFGPRQQGQPGFGPDFRDRGPWNMRPDFDGRPGFDRFDRRHGHHHFPFFAPFFLIFGLVKLAGFALLVWLLFKFFQSRRDRPSGA